MIFKRSKELSGHPIKESFVINHKNAVIVDNKVEVSLVKQAIEENLREKRSTVCFIEDSIELYRFVTKKNYPNLRVVSLKGENDLYEQYEEEIDIDSPYIILVFTYPHILLNSYSDEGSTYYRNLQIVVDKYIFGALNNNTDKLQIIFHHQDSDFVQPILENVNWNKDVFFHIIDSYAIRTSYLAYADFVELLDYSETNSDEGLDDNLPDVDKFHKDAVDFIMDQLPTITLPSRKEKR